MNLAGSWLSYGIKSPKAAAIAFLGAPQAHAQNHSTKNCRRSNVVNRFSDVGTNQRKSRKEKPQVKRVRTCTGRYCIPPKARKSIDNTTFPATNFFPTAITTRKTGLKAPSIRRAAAPGA